MFATINQTKNTTGARISGRSIIGGTIFSAVLLWNVSASKSTSGRVRSSHQEYKAISIIPIDPAKISSNNSRACAVIRTCAFVVLVDTVTPKSRQDVSKEFCPERCCTHPSIKTGSVGIAQCPSHNEYNSILVA